MHPYMYVAAAECVCSFGVEVSHFRSGAAQVPFFVSLSEQGAARLSSSMEAAVYDTVDC